MRKLIPIHGSTEKARIATLARHDRNMGDFTPSVWAGCIITFRPALRDYREKLIEKLTTTGMEKLEKLPDSDRARLKRILGKILEKETRKANLSNHPDGNIGAEIDRLADTVAYIAAAERPVAYAEFAYRQEHLINTWAWLTIIADRQNMQIRNQTVNKNRQNGIFTLCNALANDPTPENLDRLFKRLTNRSSVFRNFWKRWTEERKTELLQHLQKPSGYSSAFAAFSKNIVLEGVALCQYNGWFVLAKVAKRVDVPDDIAAKGIIEYGYLLDQQLVFDPSQQQRQINTPTLPRGWTEHFGTFYVISPVQPKQTARTAWIDLVFGTDGNNEEKIKGTIQHELEHFFHIKGGLPSFENDEYPAFLAQAAFSNTQSEFISRFQHVDTTPEPHGSALKKMREGFKQALGLHDIPQLKKVSKAVFQSTARKLLNECYMNAVGLSYDELLAPFRPL